MGGTDQGGVISRTMLMTTAKVILGDVTCNQLITLPYLSIFGIERGLVQQRREVLNNDSIAESISSS
jgi:hypothetical protein